MLKDEAASTASYTYDDAWAELGGEGVVAPFKQLSQRLTYTALRENRAKKNSTQSCEMQSLNLQDLTVWAARVKPAYDRLMLQIVEGLATQGVRAEPVFLNDEHISPDVVQDVFGRRCPARQVHRGDLEQIAGGPWRGPGFWASPTRQPSQRSCRGSRCGRRGRFCGARPRQCQGCSEMSPDNQLCTF